MKFKHVPGLSHNFTHSFVSAMNPVGNDSAYIYMLELARRKPGRVITVYWIPSSDLHVRNFSEPMRKSIYRYREWLPLLMKDHGLSPEMFKSLRTEVCIGKDNRPYVRAVAIDARGKMHAKFVQT